MQAQPGTAAITTGSVWKIDPAHSRIEFSVKHMMIATVRGRFTRFDGTLDLDEAHPERSHVEGKVEVDSLTTHQEQRDGHLRSPDFFDVDKYPEMTFHSTRIEPIDRQRFKVTGDLTTRDITRPVTFDVTYEGKVKDPYGNEKIGFSAQTRLNRKDFGLNWNVALEAGGWMVGDDVRVDIELEVMPEEAWQAMMQAFKPGAPEATPHE